jgi:hypothetical protein
MSVAISGTERATVPDVASLIRATSGLTGYVRSQSFLNTIDAIQPVISAMKAVTSP